MNEVYTNWSKATTDIAECLNNFLSCIRIGHNAWIEIQTNGEQEYPIMKENPVLDSPFSWKSMYETIRPEEGLNHTFFNETERDLTLNWTNCFGTKEAVEAYQKENRVIKGLINDGSVAYPVRITDAKAYRKKYDGEEYPYERWVCFWQPKEGIPYQIVDDSIKDVFVVCYDNEASDPAENIKRAGQFLLKYANMLKSS